MHLPKFPRKREGLLWILGGRTAAQLHRSVAESVLCGKIFKRCDFTFGHVHTTDGRPSDVYSQRFLKSIRTVVRRLEMDDKSVLVLIPGLEIILSANFSAYQRLVKQMIKVLGETRETVHGQKELLFKGIVIWTTMATPSGSNSGQYHRGENLLTTQVSRCLTVITN